MPFVVKLSSTNNAFAYNGSDFTSNCCRVSLLAIQQQDMKYDIHFLSSVHPSRLFDLSKFHAVKRGRSIDLSTWRVRPYLGGDDLRDPDLERSNQLVAACASHAASVKRFCFSES